MPETPESRAIRDQTEAIVETFERLDEAFEHLTEHICCVCRHYYGTDDRLEEEKDHSVRSGGGISVRGVTGE